MPERRERAEVYYVNKCEVCGKEAEVSPGYPSNICPSCKAKQERQAAVVSLEFLKGAIVLEVKPVNRDKDEVELIRVETITGKVIEFTAVPGTYEDGIIAWRMI